MTVAGEVTSGNAVKGAKDQLGLGAIGEELANAVFHLAGGFDSKGRDDDVLRAETLVEEPSGASCESVRLSAAGAREDGEGVCDGGDGGALRGIEGVEEGGGGGGKSGGGSGGRSGEYIVERK